MATVSDGWSVRTETPTQASYPLKPTTQPLKKTHLPESLHKLMLEVNFFRHISWQEINILLITQYKIIGDLEYIIKPQAISKFTKDFYQCNECSRHGLLHSPQQQAGD